MYPVGIVNTFNRWHRLKRVHNCFANGQSYMYVQRDGQMDGWKASRKMTTTSFTICNKMDGWKASRKMITTSFTICNNMDGWKASQKMTTTSFTICNKQARGCSLQPELGGSFIWLENLWFFWLWFPIWFWKCQIGWTKTDEMILACQSKYPSTQHSLQLVIGG